MSEQKQRFLSTLIVSVGAFLGFEALTIIVGLYQIRTYLLLSIYVYLFHVFWLTFLFDLHFKNRGVLANARLNYKGWRMLSEALKDRVRHIFNWEYIRHYQNYLVLPGIIYWAVVILLFLNPFKDLIKQTIIIAASLSMTVAYWYMKEVFSRRMETTELGIKILGLVKLFAAFLIYSATLGASWYFGMGDEFIALSIFALTFLLAYQALFQHRLLNFYTYMIIVVISLVIAVVSMLIYYYWGTGYLTGGLVMLAVYNTFWGLLHHHLDRTLSRKLVFEYFLMMILVLSFLVGSHDFRPQIN